MLKINKDLFTRRGRGHHEDSLICILSDPRFKLLDFNGSTKDMKKDTEKFLKSNYKADWRSKSMKEKSQDSSALINKEASSCVPTYPSYFINTKQQHEKVDIMKMI
jgi:hypothetical protein